MGTDQVYTPEAIHENGFEVRPVAVTNERQWTKYRIRNLARELREYRPDVIFCIHEEVIVQLQQTILYRRLFAPKAKLLYFSMMEFPRVPAMKSWSFKEIRKRVGLWLFWWFIRHGTDGAVVHYPAIKAQMRREKYRKPILLQTQHGVSEKVFTPDSEDRELLRNELGLEGFVVGFAGRLCHQKGLHDLMEALERLEGDWSLLAIGDGEGKEDLLNWAKEHFWEERIHLPGFVDHDKVARYMRAMDCLVLMSRTTKTWVDTFPLVVAQAMTCGVPVIGSASGAIPYQLGNTCQPVPEGDIQILGERLQMLRSSPEERAKTAICQRQRALQKFCIESMNQHFLDFIEDDILS